MDIPSGSGGNNLITGISVTSKYARSKYDRLDSPLWIYATLLEEKSKRGGNVKWRCNYCNASYTGSYSRVKSHLLRERGHGITVCPVVKNEYVLEMKQLEASASKKGKELTISPISQIDINPKKGKEITPLIDFDPEHYKKRRTHDTQIVKYDSSITQQLDDEIANMFYSGGLSFYLARNPHFIKAFTLAANSGLAGYVPPTFNDLKTKLLHRAKAKMCDFLQPLRENWVYNGVSIVADGWTDLERRPIINFIAVSDSSAMFLKSISSNGEYKDEHYVASLILSIVGELGHSNVIQVITDNSPVCRAAGLVIEQSFPHISWTPCVVYTLNLVLKTICASKSIKNNDISYTFHWINEVSEAASFIRSFIMNHPKRLLIYSKFIPFKMLAIVDTRFASTIVMLKKFKEIKHDLQVMVKSDQWRNCDDEDNIEATQVETIILNENWWSYVDYILDFTFPIYEMLRTCDSCSPKLHLVHEMWLNMVEDVKKAIFQDITFQVNQPLLYNVVHCILHERWSKELTPLYCMAHSLNPRYYCKKWLSTNQNWISPHLDKQISEGRIQYLSNFFQDEQERLSVLKEYVEFSTGVEKMSLRHIAEDRSKLKAKDWWVTYGWLFPKLQSLGAKILSQPCSASCCEKNWSTYSFIHSPKRHKLALERAEDLVFVHTNLRLLSRRSDDYCEGVSKMWDVVGDEFFKDSSCFDLNLSLDEPDLESVIFPDIEIDH